MKKILVAGGAGFIGANLVRRLLWDGGSSVTVLDNLSSGNMDNIQAYIDVDRLGFIKHDVTEPIDLKVDEIYNLACPASPSIYQIDPVKTMKTNVLGSINLLDLARKNDAKILQASTSEVYGSALCSIQSECYLGNVNQIGVRACYDEGKRAAETMFFDYWRTYGVQIKVARIFNAYGPYMQPNDGRVISSFICQSLAGDTITVYGDGTQTRSFCYVDDMVTALMKLMSSQLTGPINLGRDQEVSIRDIALQINCLTRSASEIKMFDLPPDDPPHRRPDLSLSRSELKWESQTSLHDGLIKTIKWFDR